MKVQRNRSGPFWVCECCGKSDSWKYAYIRLDGPQAGQSLCPLCAEPSPALFSEVEVGTKVKSFNAIHAHFESSNDKYKRALDEIKEFVDAVDGLIEKADKIYSVADTLLQMEMAFDEFWDLGRAALIGNFGEAITKVKELRKKL